MSQGHTIPILHLARLLHRRLLSITVLTTPANSPSIRSSLLDTTISVVDLPFPVNIPGVPPGIESTDELPSISFLVPFVTATKLIQTHFEQVIESLPTVHCIISDGFLGWTQQSADKLGIPRVLFYGMSNHAMTLSSIMLREKPHAMVSSVDEVFSVPGLPWVNLTTNDFEPPLSELEPKGALFDFVAETSAAAFKSHGILVNGSYELEPRFNNYWNQKIGPRAWCFGPLCLAEPPRVQTLQKPTWVQWLDKKSAQGKSVLYVAFGSQAEMAPEQLHEIVMGLERSEVEFLWFVKGFEERLKKRALIVKEWVDQRELLAHQSVKGFLSHCGWNSVMESVSASVPILAFPLMAEQHLNARMVVDELGIGLRILASNGSVRGFVESKDVERMVRELMERGEKGKEVRKKVKEVGEAARAAMGDGGPSSRTLDLFIDEVCNKKLNLLPSPA
ncbi:hypothetical protein PVL29_022595 [Vitis rotundifolia]|uniref:Glycosyltransferase n=1 Tax=Vitis rotundifolia TaxID=103349 RepID=A0AA38YVZ4_VITRO|nr:hypothetical protein PVL29_022595 [Vitis rotundifolia]